MSAPFFSAPHRVMFLGGAIQALIAILTWGIDLAARQAGLWQAPQWPLPAPWWHALTMLYGVFPFFIFGFILTAGPRWQGAPDTPSRVFVPAFLGMAAGWALIWLSPLLAALLVPGLALVMAGWGVALVWLWQVGNRPDRDRLHIRVVAAGVALGVAGMAALAAFALGAEARWARLGIELGLWGVLLPIFVTVAHRMLPFFTSAVVPNYAVYRADWTLQVMVAASLLHGVLSWLDMPAWTWLADLPAAGVAVHLSRRWRLRDSLGQRMVAVLHIAFAWVALAFALFAVGSLMSLAGRDALGLVPLHALTLGFFASMLIGMATRVTLGHSGLPVRDDGVMWPAFWAMQAAALLRILAELAGPAAAWLSLPAALLWAGAFAVWTWRHGPKFLRRRADGKPG
ncbi:MAG: NnrS family protein [Gammaproteobacteria bacterium]|nr:NnrS family protein [Gammaproteobacteria bacterium]MBU1647156.1 NnrS family protein [Gammaproteobacteria bacterium]MBU1972668.1 NnrS family protein [Gammaproteobacteria bacterium]